MAGWCMCSGLALHAHRGRGGVSALVNQLPGFAASLFTFRCDQRRDREFRVALRAVIVRQTVLTDDGVSHGLAAGWTITIAEDTQPPTDDQTEPAENQSHIAQAGETHVRSRPCPRQQRQDREGQDQRHGDFGREPHPANCSPVSTRNEQHHGTGRSGPEALIGGPKLT